MSLDPVTQRLVEEHFNRYAEALDDGPLDRWPELFAADCLYLVQPRENFDANLPLAIIRCESRGMLADRVMAISRAPIVLGNMPPVGETDGFEKVAFMGQVPAKIVGAEHRIGSIEVGKDADLLILDGDPLHYRTFVETAIVNGKVAYQKDKEPFYSHIKR